MKPINKSNALIVLFVMNCMFLFSQSDTITIKKQFKALDTLIRTDLNLAKKVALKCVHDSKSFANKEYTYRSLLNLSDVLFFNDQEDSVIKILEPLLVNIPKEVKTKTIAGITYRLSSSYANLFQFEKGLEFSFKAYDYWEQLKDTTKLVNILVNVATIYQQQGNFLASDKKLIEALGLANKLRKKTALGNVYNSRGILYAENQKTDSALIFLLKSTEIRESLKDFTSVVWNYNNLGGVYMMKQDWKNAYKWYNKAKSRFEETGNENGLSTVYSNLGEISLNLKSYPESINYFKLARLHCSFNNNPDLLENLYTNLSAYYQKTGDADKAIMYSDSLVMLKDSLHGKQLGEKLAEMEVKYQTEKKDLELIKSKTEINFQTEKLKQKNYLISLGCLVILLLVFAAYFYFKNIQSKNKLQLELQQQKLSLKVIDAEQTERIRIARELHDGIGQKLTVLKMYASVNPDENKKQIDLLDNTITEVRNLSHNLIPEILNLGLFSALRDLCDKINLTNNITCNFTYNEPATELKFEKNIEVSVYRIVQEVVNNMLKHAKANVITINLQKEDDKLLIKIADNGLGFDTKTIHQSKGIGWSNILTRAKIINAKLEVESDKNGTNINLQINL